MKRNCVNLRKMGFDKGSPFLALSQILEINYCDFIISVRNNGQNHENQAKVVTNQNFFRMRVRAKKCHSTDACEPHTTWTKLAQVKVVEKHTSVFSFSYPFSTQWVQRWGHQDHLSANSASCISSLWVVLRCWMEGWSSQGSFHISWVQSGFDSTCATVQSREFSPNASRSQAVTHFNKVALSLNE